MKKKDFNLELSLIYAVVGVIICPLGVMIAFAVKDFRYIIIGGAFALAGAYLIYNFIAKLMKIKKAVKENPEMLDECKVVRLTKKDGSTVWICPNCKKEIVAKSQFCNFCGENIDGAFVEKTEI